MDRQDLIHTQSHDLIIHQIPFFVSLRVLRGAFFGFCGSIGFVGSVGPVKYVSLSLPQISPQYHLPVLIPAFHGELPQRNRLRIPQGRRDRRGKQRTLRKIVNTTYFNLHDFKR